jgi:transposase-like protein
MKTGGAFSMSGTKGMLHYTAEIKQRAVALFVEEQRSYASIAKELGIRKPERIEVWVKMYRREGVSSFCKPIGRPRKEACEQSELERLRMENALLKKFQAELREVLLVQRNIG